MVVSLCVPWRMQKAYQVQRGTSLSFLQRGHWDMGWKVMGPHSPSSAHGASIRVTLKVTNCMLSSFSWLQISGQMFSCSRGNVFTHLSNCKATSVHYIIAWLLAFTVFWLSYSTAARKGKWKERRLKALEQTGMSSSESGIARVLDGH